MGLFSNMYGSYCHVHVCSRRHICSTNNAYICVYMYISISFCIYIGLFYGSLLEHVWFFLTCACVQSSTYPLDLVRRRMQTEGFIDTKVGQESVNIYVDMYIHAYIYMHIAGHADQGLY